MMITRHDDEHDNKHDDEHDDEHPVLLQVSRMDLVVLVNWAMMAIRT